MFFSGNTQKLLTASEAYFYLGYSVIPLLGDLDPSRPKVPAIPWANYQRYRASLQEQQQWFREGGFAGLGIVTGRISQLIVFDFDSQNILADFKIQFPDLMETHIVQSAGRQLPHLYFHLPDHLHITSMKAQGVDLLSDGRYVVAPPTTIAGQSYKITRGGMPKTLTEKDIGRLRAFMSRYAAKSANSTDHTKTSAMSLQRPTTPQGAALAATDRTTSQDLTTRYGFHCQQGGRNEALFRTSLYARDAGWLLTEAQNILAPLHSQQPTSASHHRETPAQRQREAIRTIHSAFSRPARHIIQQGFLSNSVREALLKQKKTYVIRTIEGLGHTGIQPEQLFTADEALKRLKDAGIKVGRDSVLKALKAGWGGQGFFDPPISPPETANAIATDNSQKESKKMLFEGGKNQYKPQGGRPAHLYKMPSNVGLCDILGVKVTHSDPLESNDLASVQKTRMGLHRELIKRSPRQYPLGWLARRLNVSKRTIAAYNKLIPIHSRAMFIETPINWKTIERLPFDEPLQGAVLVTLKGKKHPALRTIASRLLGSKEIIYLKQQTANFYWYGNEEPILTRLQVQQDRIVQQERIETFVAKQLPKPAPMRHKPLLFIPPLSPQPVVEKGSAREAVETKPPRYFRQPLIDTAQEVLANSVYDTLNRLTSSEQKRLSLANARRLVTTYSSEAITSALNLVTQRQAITNPIGFVVTVLRSAARAG